MTGTLMPESTHPMVRLLSAHQAALESLRAAYGELSGATAPLHNEAERVFIDVDDPGATSSMPHARHEMPVSKTTDFLLARRAYENAMLATQLLPQSLLVAMVSQHDAFIGHLLRTLFALRPDLRGRIRRPVSLAELRAFDGIDDLAAKLVDDEIRDVLRSSHSAQLTWISALLDVRLDSDSKLLERFREVVQRRHLYAHNGGLVNAKYIQARRAVDSGYCGQPGDALDLSTEDFERAFDVLMEIAVKLWQVTWRKARRDQVDQAEEALYRLGYELLVFERFALARCVLEFAVQMPKHAHESIRRKNIVNLAQSCKWLGDEDACRRHLAGDWSAYEESFTLAIAVLEDRYDDAERLMLRTGDKGDIVQQAFLDWPLFRRFRETEHFARAYAQLFGTPAEHAA